MWAWSEVGWGLRRGVATRMDGELLAEQEWEGLFQGGVVTDGQGVEEGGVAWRGSVVSGRAPEMHGPVGQHSVSPHRFGAALPYSRPMDPPHPYGAHGVGGGCTVQLGGLPHRSGSAPPIDSDCHPYICGAAP